METAPDWRPFFRDIPKNAYHNNFKILKRFVPSSLNDEEILEMAKDFAQKILLAFGVNDLSMCFIDDKIDVNSFVHIRHL